jgi:hypothetical protein
MIAEANIVILVCIFTIVLLKFVSCVQYILPVLTELCFSFHYKFSVEKKQTNKQIILSQYEIGIT